MADRTASISIAPLNKSLSSIPTGGDVTTEAIADAFALIFRNEVSQVQYSDLLTILRCTGRENDPEILAACAARMREAASQVDRRALRSLARQRGRKEGSYRGGYVCTISSNASLGHKLTVMRSVILLGQEEMAIPPSTSLQQPGS